MINEISNNASSLKLTKKVEINPSEDKKHPKSEIDKRSDLAPKDTVEITGNMPVEASHDNVIDPVNGKGNEVQMQSDILHQEATTNLQGTENSKKETIDQTELSDEERKEIEELKNRDAEVRQHEHAHAAAAGAYAQGVSFQYQAGPDGKRYAVGGEVSIDTSPVHDNPDATIAKARTIRAAANAPADPSAQDRQVAAAAIRMETSARAEKTRETTGGEEGQKIESREVNNQFTVDDTNDPAQEMFAEDKGTLVESLTSAYGQKETEVGKVIRVTA